MDATTTTLLSTYLWTLPLPSVNKKTTFNHTPGKLQKMILNPKWWKQAQKTRYSVLTGAMRTPADVVTLLYVLNILHQRAANDHASWQPLETNDNSNSSEPSNPRALPPPYRVHKWHPTMA